MKLYAIAYGAYGVGNTLFVINLNADSIRASTKSKPQLVEMN